MFRNTAGVAMLAALMMSLAGCGSEDKKDGKAGKSKVAGGGSSGGTITIDGSSTVVPITSRVAEAYMNLDSAAKVNVMAPSGTGGGFKKFVAGETDINDASRPIKDKEIAKCKESGIEFLELKVAIDGISVVVSPENDWCKALTVAQLKAMWEPNSKVSKWSDLNPEWPAEDIKLFGPDADSGTFDYFTEVICGETKKCRDDYEPSSDDNVLVTGVTGDKYALGYFGFAYYIRNQDKLRAVPVSATDSPADAVEPTAENIEAGKYVPLARPLFIYVNKARLADETMVKFLKFYLGAGQSEVGEAGYVQLSKDALAEASAALQAAL